MTFHCRWCEGAMIRTDHEFPECVDCGASMIPRRPGHGQRISEEEMVTGWYRPLVDGWACLIAGPDRLAEEPSWPHWCLERFSPWSYCHD